MGYNAVPFSDLAQACINAGFDKTVQAGQEIVFERAHRADPRLRVRVYTSNKVGKESVAAKGKDAIRVCLVGVRQPGTKWERTWGICSSTRVHRTGTTAAIIERMVDRMREMYTAASELLKNDRCVHCAAPVFADSKRCVLRCYGDYQAANAPAAPKQVVAEYSPSMLAKITAIEEAVMGEGSVLPLATTSSAKANQE